MDDTDYPSLDFNSPNPFLIEESIGPVKKRAKRERASSDRYITPSAAPQSIQKYARDCKMSSTDLLSTPTKSGYLYPITPTATPSKKGVVREWNRLMAQPSLFYARTPKSQKSARRGISRTPDLVLDAPGARDDFYTRLIDWSPSGNMLVGLGGICYTGLLQSVYEGVMPDYISAVSFSPLGNLAAIGSDHGSVKIFDFEKSTTQVQASFEQDDLSTMIWKNEQSLVTGDAVGTIRFWDTRSMVSRVITGQHQDRVCGIARSCDSFLLATGGNGARVNVWDERKLNKPLWLIEDHTSAVRAMAWCPWAPQILATGGGLDDGRIIFHNTDSGSLIKTINTNSQICDLVWSEHYRELITAQNSKAAQLVIWKYSTGERITTLPGHLHRALNLSLSPDGQTVASLGDDESLKFWKVFGTSENARRLTQPLNPELQSLTIR